MQANAGNFTPSIHTQEYELPYLEKQTGAADMIFDANRPRVQLGGQWQFGADQYDTCLRQRWFEEKTCDSEGRQYPLDYSFDEWEAITVPSCWNLRKSKNLDKDLYLYEGSVVYTRTFTFHPRPADDHSRTGEYLKTDRVSKNGMYVLSSERVFLRFGAANRTCKVFLNSQYLGMHTGGHTPFYFEVTHCLKEENRLIAVVNNTRRQTDVPTDNTDWFNYGGLYRDVALLHLPETFIKDFFIALVPDGTYSRIKASVKVDGKEQNGKASLAIEQLGINIDIPVKDGAGEIELEANPKLWSPDNPELYDVRVTYGKDAVRDKVGFREVKVSDGRIFLNGEEVYLKGVCAHEESVPNGNAVTEEEIRESFKLAKEMGCNFMRLAHYPHSEAAARIADEAGLLLWEEIPVYWAIAFENEATYKNAENQLSELILRDRNRASVIIWSVGNENADTDERYAFMSRLAETARGLDSTRLISAACLVDSEALVIKDRLAENLDIIGINEYYGWYEPDFSKLPKIFENSKPGKPVVITEFGADAKPKSGGAAGELYTEENQRAVYEKQLEVLSEIPYIKGICPWIFFDFRCPRRLHPMQNYYNIKGLLSADKKHKKPAFEVMRKFYLSF